MYSQTAASPDSRRRFRRTPAGRMRRRRSRTFSKDSLPSSFAPGEAIFWEGDQAGQIFDVLEGVLRVYRILPDGRRAIMGFIYPGDILGVSFQDRYLFTAEAVTDVKVRRFSRGRFFSLVNKSPALRPQLFALLCDEMSAAQDQMLLLGRKSAEERVVSFLLAVHRKSGAGNEIAAADEPARHGRLSRPDDRDGIANDDQSYPARPDCRGWTSHDRLAQD